MSRIGVAERGQGEAVVRTFPPETQMSMKVGAKVQFCPWVSSATVETTLLVSDLMFTIDLDHLDEGHQTRRLVRSWAMKPRVVYVMNHQGHLMATHTKCLEAGEIWRLSLGRTVGGKLTYGLAAFGGPPTACHFQISGGGTFATCHSRRMTVLAPPAGGDASMRWARWIPNPRRHGSRMSLLIMNYLAGANRVSVVSCLDEGRGGPGVTFELPTWGSRLVDLGRLPRSPRDGEWDLYQVTAAGECDFYTVVQNTGDSDGAFSVQHVK